MKYILILTLLGKIGSGGMGGVATHSFDDISKCHEVGQIWQKQMRRNKYFKSSFYICAGTDLKPSVAENQD